jgi:hypothetical protein
MTKQISWNIKTRIGFGFLYHRSGRHLFYVNDLTIRLGRFGLSLMWNNKVKELAYSVKTGDISYKNYLLEIYNYKKQKTFLKKGGYYDAERSKKS